MLDGGDQPEPDYSMLTLGGRFWIAQTGWAVSAGLNANLDMLVRHGDNPVPFGGIVGHHVCGVAAGSPAAGGRPAPEPIVEQPRPVEAAPAPATAPRRRVRRLAPPATRSSSTERARA